MLKFNDWVKKYDDEEMTTNKNFTLDTNGSLPVFVLEPPHLDDLSTTGDTNDEINIEDEPEIKSVPQIVGDYLSNKSNNNKSKE